VRDTPNIEMSEADVAVVAAAARDGEPDRYLAALLAPPPQRQALLALAAFSAEIRRIPALVHEPAMGEIRRQWWRDALAMAPELRSGNPVADTVRAAARAHGLPADLLVGVIDAMPCEPRNDASLGDEALRAYLWGAEGALFALAAQILTVPAGPEATAACAASGHASGLVRLLLGLPQSIAWGRPTASAERQVVEKASTMREQSSLDTSARIKSLAEEHAAQIRGSLAAARQFARELPRLARVAFLPLALVEPYLRILERSSDRFLAEGARIAPLMRVCRIAAAHLSGRF
jgi:15-cis-phytoene synthase